MQRTVKKFGNGAHILMPKETIGMDAKVKLSKELNFDLNKIKVEDLISHITNLKAKTGKDWYVKASKGSIKLVEDSE